VLPSSSRAIRRFGLAGFVSMLTLSPQAFAVLYFVDASVPSSGTGTGTWANAKKTIQEALDDPNATEVRVAAGTYRPTKRDNLLDPRSATIHLRKNLSLLGGWPVGGGLPGSRNPELHITTITGDVFGDDGPNFSNYGDNCYRVLSAISLVDDEFPEQSIYVDDTAVVNGFTIAAGSADDPALPSGGGLRCEQASPTIIRCNFLACRSSVNGGGIYALDNAFSGFTTVTPMRLVNCTFAGCAADGFGGGMGCDRTHIQLTNCVFTGCAAGEVGGGLACKESAVPTLIHCTFASNTLGPAGLAGAGASIDSIEVAANGLVQGCVIWQNSPDGLLVGPPCVSPPAPCGVVNVRTSNIQGGVPTHAVSGTGNITADPLFIDANGADAVAGTLDDDLRLRNGSPCLDRAGSNDLPDDLVDLDEDLTFFEPLPWDRRKAGRVADLLPCTSPTVAVDMGAYERLTSCFADLDGDCLINGKDLATLLAAWSGASLYLPCQPYAPADLNCDCRVDGLDLALLLGAWGACATCDIGGDGGFSGAAAMTLPSAGMESEDPFVEWALQASFEELMDWLGSWLSGG
jgi:hypothetical protein